jgi:hypothetical protein
MPGQNIIAPTTRWSTNHKLLAHPWAVCLFLAVAIPQEEGRSTAPRAGSMSWFAQAGLDTVTAEDHGE